MDEEYDRRLNEYIEMGAVELEGMDESGQAIFSITEKAKEVAPELWESHQRYVDFHLTQLYKMGFAAVDYDENLEATITLSPEGYQIAKRYGLIEMDINKDIPNN